MSGDPVITNNLQKSKFLSSADRDRTGTGITAQGIAVDVGYEPTKVHIIHTITFLSC